MLSRQQWCRDGIVSVIRGRVGDPVRSNVTLEARRSTGRVHVWGPGPRSRGEPGARGGTVRAVYDPATVLRGRSRPAGRRARGEVCGGLVEGQGRGGGSRPRPCPSRSRRGNDESGLGRKVGTAQVFVWQVRDRAGRRPSAARARDRRVDGGSELSRRRKLAHVGRGELEGACYRSSSGAGTGLSALTETGEGAQVGVT
jgi:hypothetical protein